MLIGKSPLTWQIFFIQKTIKIQVEKEYIYTFIKIPSHRWYYSPFNRKAQFGWRGLVSYSFPGEKSSGDIMFAPLGLCDWHCFPEMGGQVERCYPNSVSLHSKKACDLRQCQCDL